MNHQTKHLKMSVAAIPMEQSISPCSCTCPTMNSTNKLHSTRDDLSMEKRLQTVRGIVGGSWKFNSKVKIEKITGGLSNYLYKLSLSDDVKLITNEPRHVLVRIYGDALQGNADSMLMDSIIFALLSEKGIGPQLYGVFPGGRVEQYIESRVLKREELRLPHMSSRIASILARLHTLHMPISKSPERYFRIMKEYHDYLRKEYDHLPDTVKHVLSKCNIIEECKWMKSTFLEEHPSSFPVVFCHNDLQENNLLYLESEEDENGFKLMPIDFEYSSYGFRGYDIGNHFNEWCYDYTVTEWPYYSYTPEAYPSKEEQKSYLTTFS